MSVEHFKFCHREELRSIEWELRSIDRDLQHSIDQAHRDADSIERSQCNTTDAVERLGTMISELALQSEIVATAVGEYLPAMLHTLEATDGSIQQLLDVHQNPTATAGKEYARRAALAYRHGWTTEALQDLDASVSAYPYSSGVHCLRGMTLRRMDRTAEAARALSDAARYGVADNVPLAVSAALGSAASYADAGEPAESLRVLRETAARIPNSPQVALDLAMRSGEEADLSAALRLDPSFVVVARVQRLPGLERAAEFVLDEPDGWGRNYEQARRLLQDASRHPGVTYDAAASFPAVPEQAPPSAGLALIASHASRLNHALGSASQTVETYDRIAVDGAGQALAEATASDAPSPRQPQPPRDESGPARRKLMGARLVSAALLVLGAVMLVSGLSTATEGPPDFAVLLPAVVLMSIAICTPLSSAYVLWKVQIRKSIEAQHDHAQRMLAYEKAKAGYRAWFATRQREVSDARDRLEELRRRQAHDTDTLIGPARAIRAFLDRPVVHGLPITEVELPG